MKRTLLATILLAIAGASMTTLGCGHGGKIERATPVKVAIMPEYSLNVMASRYAPLISYLQAALGPAYRVEWISCPSSEAFLATVERERPALSLQDAFHTAMLVRLQGATPLLQMLGPGSRATSRGVIVTAGGTAPGDLASLAGRSVWIPSRRSFLGYAAQAALLERSGVSSRSGIRFVTARWQDRVVEGVRDRTADAGFIEEAAVAPDLHVLARTDEFPNGCAVIFRHTDPDVAAKIRQALLALGTGGSPSLANAGIEGFRPVDEATRAAILALPATSSIPY